MHKRIAMALSVGIIGRVIGYAFGALFGYVTMHLFAEHEYGLSVAFAGSFFAVMGWAIGLLGGYITGFELYKDG